MASFHVSYFLRQVENRLVAGLSIKKKHIWPRNIGIQPLRAPPVIQKANMETRLLAQNAMKGNVTDSIRYNNWPPGN